MHLIEKMSLKLHRQNLSKKRLILFSLNKPLLLFLLIYPVYVMLILRNNQYIKSQVCSDMCYDSIDCSSSLRLIITIKKLFEKKMNIQNILNNANKYLKVRLLRRDD